MDAGSTIHGIPQWEHPKQVGCGDEVIDVAPQFSPRRPGMIISNQLLPPRTPTTVSTTSQSTLLRTNVSPKQGAEQSKRSPPNTNMDHRALLKMDGLSPDKMLIAFDSDSHSCCPSVGDITWDQSEAMAFQQSAMDKHASKSQQPQQHPWQNFTELQPSSPRVVAKDRPPSVTTTARPNRPTDPPASPRRSKNQLAAYGKTHVSKEKPKQQSSSKPSTDRTSRSRSPTRCDKGSQPQAMTVSPDVTTPPRTSTVQSPMRRKFERNEIDLSFNMGSGTAVEKCPDAVNLAALFRQKKERNRKEPPVAPVPPGTTSSARPKSRTHANARSRTNALAPPEQYWPGTHGPSNATKPNSAVKQPSVVQQEIHFVSVDAPSGPGTAGGTVTPDAIPAPKRSGPAAEGTRLHFDDHAGSLTGTSWKKLNCSKSSLHSSSKHIEESIQSLETTLFGNLSTSTGALLSDAQKMESTRSGIIPIEQRGAAQEDDDDDEGDDYDVVNEIVDDYIDFDTAMAMTSAIMED